MTGTDANKRKNTKIMGLYLIYAVFDKYRNKYSLLRAEDVQQNIIMYECVCVQVTQKPS